MSLEPNSLPDHPLRLGSHGRFELRPAEHRLLVDGEPATLGGRALDLLMTLASRPAELFTKGELLSRVWPGLVVEEGNLRVQINGLRRLLGEDAIATVPGRGYRLCLLLPASPDVLAVAPHAATLPAGALLAQGLFGRDADLAQLEQQLAPGTCVTVVGLPGVGKSSLARAVLARWPGPGVWVDLAPLTQAEQIPGAIARAMGSQLDGGDAVVQLLGQLSAHAAPLLVLDNAEHLLAGCADWASRLRAAPALRLLVTSQAALNVSGERRLNLEPLTLSSQDTASDGAALALLLDRIAAADRRFQPSPATLPLLNALCRQLDGLPLALEMAATRVPLMGVRAVHDALADRFALLSRGRRDAAMRHHSLLDALDWSYGLLESAEQRLFRALGVCAGGFALDLAVTLASDEHVSRWDVVDGLATLVERSLVSVDGHDPPRYRLLETLRAYALDKLGGGVDPHERWSRQQRHAMAILALFSTGADEAGRLAEMDNVREAFIWARTHDLALAAQLGVRVTQVVIFSVWRQEAADWMLSLRDAMTQAAGQALPLLTQAAWWSGLAHLLNVRRDHAALPAARQAVRLWRQLDDADELQAALGHWVRAVGETGPELDEACAALQRSAEAGSATPRAALRVYGALAEAALLRHDNPTLLMCREQQLAAATELALLPMMEASETNVCAALIALERWTEAAERGRALLERMDAVGSENNGNLPWALHMLAEARTPLRDFAGTIAIIRRLRIADARFGTAVSWATIVPMVLAQDRLRVGARLLGHLDHSRQQRADDPGPGFMDMVDRLRAAVQQRLETRLVATLAAEGRLLSEEQVVALALSEAD